MGLVAPWHVGILDPWPGIKLMSLTLVGGFLINQTTRKAPNILIKKKKKISHYFFTTDQDKSISSKQYCRYSLGRDALLWAGHPDSCFWYSKFPYFWILLKGTCSSCVVQHVRTPPTQPHGAVSHHGSCGWRWNCRNGRATRGWFWTPNDFTELLSQSGLSRGNETKFCM